MKITHNAAEVAGGIEAYQVKFFRTVRTTVKRQTELIVSRAVDIIKRRDTISSGDLFKSITSAVRVARDQVLGTVGSNLPYAVFAHEGTRPHWPPVRAMQEWVTQQIRRGKMRLSPGDTVEGLAYVIGRGISRRGTKGSKFLAIAARLQQGAMIREVGAAISKLNVAQRG